MVLSGAWQIFERSLATYNVRYIEYLGDGDSKGFVSTEMCIRDRYSYFKRQ